MNIEQKTQWINVMSEHRAADRIIQGAWIRDKDDAGLFRGCFFGCAMQTDNNPIQRAAAEMGLPEWFVRLAERIFEGLPSDVAGDWPLQLLNAIPADKDLEPIRHTLAIKRIDRLIEMHKDCTEYGLLDALQLTRGYHISQTEESRTSAESAARSAESAARSAAWSAAWSAAESAAWLTERDTLLESLSTM